MVWLPCEHVSYIKSLPQSQEFSGLKRSKGGIPDVEKSAFHWEEDKSTVTHSYTGAVVHGVTPRSDPCARAPKLFFLLH